MPTPGSVRLFTGRERAEVATAGSADLVELTADLTAAEAEFDAALDAGLGMPVLSALDREVLAATRRLHAARPAARRPA